LLIIAGVIGVILRYYPFGKGDELANIPLISTEAGDEETPAVFVPPKPTPQPRPEPNLAEITPALTAESDSKAGQLIAEAMDLINAKPARLIDARDILNDALPMCASRQQRAFVKEKLSQLTDKWLFSRTIFPQDTLCGSYKVKPGDQLRMIGKQFKVPYQILLEINNIPRPEALQAGKVIKVINGPFHAVVYRSTFTMDLYLQNTFVRSFPVGLGQPGMETPTGLWVVEPGRKLIKPRWTDPVTDKTYEPDDPDYPLGSRWIGLEGIEGNAKGRTGFAIHGTKDPNEIGTANSQGCIRLRNGNAILLYNLLVPTHSRVRVME
jgi:LysM repeat protein